ncbi:hypothetical protein Tco_0682280 [Tanacetum coccineum]|uniref:Uncharacterized protein n=1 Tax=Tanacetum coccineum TaxID=301880 RepID=A0ABQ4XRS6_9ASTR
MVLYRFYPFDFAIPTLTRADWPKDDPLKEGQVSLVSRYPPRHTDSISGPNLGTRHPAERFVISLNSSHHSSTNAEDAEVTSIVRSSVPPPPVLTAAVATTAIVWWAQTFPPLVYEVRLIQIVKHELSLESKLNTAAVQYRSWGHRCLAEF